VPSSSVSLRYLQAIRQDHATTESATMDGPSSSSKPPPQRRTVRRPLQFVSPAKEQQYRAEMDQVQQYICAQVGGLDEASSLLLGVHDSRSRSYYEEIQEFLERKQQLEQQQQQRQPQTERVLIRSLDEYLYGALALVRRPPQAPAGHVNDSRPPNQIDALYHSKPT
jgi:hypothetical protein